jgi:hypothetical protein
MLVEFETDGKDVFKDAHTALMEEMGNLVYHIWYWTFDLQQ